MKLVLAFSHYDQIYVGGLFKRAAKRLGIDVVSVGPKAGAWTPAPKESDSEPDIRASDDMPPGEIFGEMDAVILVDQSTGYLPSRPRDVPCAIVQTESNPGEPEKALAHRPDALWSLMPMKPSARVAGMLPLEWGYDPEHTPITDPASNRTIDFVMRGTSNDYRTRVRERFDSESSLISLFGSPKTRADWGHELCHAKVTLGDHDEEFIAGRIVDAMAAGCLVLCKPSPSMDMLAPRGYVPISRGTSDKWPDIEEVMSKVKFYTSNGDSERIQIATRAQGLIERFTWDNQLLRVLGSIGVRP